MPEKKGMKYGRKKETGKVTTRERRERTTKQVDERTTTVNL